MTVIPLGELLDVVLDEFSFHGSPEDTADTANKLDAMLQDDVLGNPPEALYYGLAAVFGSSEEEKEAQHATLQNTEGYLRLDKVIATTGKTEAEIDKLCEQGRMLDLVAYPTPTQPKEQGFPVQQFSEHFDKELLRYITAISRIVWHEWKLHDFLERFRIELNGEKFNGWSVLSLKEDAQGYCDMPEDVRKLMPSKLQKPMFAKGSAKGALVEAIEQEVVKAAKLFDEQTKQDEEET